MILVLFVMTQRKIITKEGTAAVKTTSSLYLRDAKLVIKSKCIKGQASSNYIGDLCGAGYEGEVLLSTFAYSC